MIDDEEYERLMTPMEVATLFKVDPKTVGRWAKAGKLTTAARTLGNHRRFLRNEVFTLYRMHRVGRGNIPPKEGVQ